MKVVAYYINDKGELEKVSGYEIARCKKKDPAKWKGVVFYSLHINAEDRLEMHHRTTGDKSYFYYKPGQEEKLARVGGGESLEHYLFKKAICGLEKVDLKIYMKNGNVVNAPIIITKAIDEYKINSEGKSYYLDVYFEFNSPESFMGIRWGNRLGFEVFNTNQVDDVKKQALNKVGIAVVEHKLNDKLKYKYKEEDSTEQRMCEYIDWIRSNITFLTARVISDYHAPDFKVLRSLYEKYKGLEDENTSMRDKTKALKDENNELMEELNWASNLSVKKQNVIDGQKKELDQYENMGIMGFLGKKVSKAFGEKPSK